MSLTSSSLISADSVPLVCIGLSAGGIGPLRTMFRMLNPDTGMTYVVISHLSRTKRTKLPWLLSIWSRMPAQLARTGLVLEPNHIYVSPIMHEHIGAGSRSE